jgi:hypothetical protein
MACNPFLEKCGEQDLPEGACHRAWDIAGAIVDASMEALAPFYDCGGNCESLVGMVTHGEPAILLPTPNVVAAWVSRITRGNQVSGRTGPATLGPNVPRRTVTAAIYLGPMALGDFVAGEFELPDIDFIAYQSKLAASMAETWWLAVNALFAGEHNVEIGELLPKGFTAAMSVWSLGVAVTG